MCGEEPPVASTLDDLSSWLRQAEPDKFVDRRDTISNVERATFPEKFLDIFLSVTHGSSVIRQGYGVWRSYSITHASTKDASVGRVNSQPSRA